MARKIVSKILSAKARIYRRRENWPAAAKSFLRVARGVKLDADLWFQAAKALEYVGDPAAAEAYRSTVEAAGVTSEHCYRYGRFLELQNKAGEALEMYQTAERLGGNIGHLSFRQARCLESLGQRTEASLKFRLASERGFDPKQCFLELRRMQSRDTPKWIQLELAREGQPFFSPTEKWSLTHGLLAQTMGYSEEAVEYLDAYHREETPDISALIPLVLALESMGEHAQAKERLDSALENLSDEESSLGHGILFCKFSMWSRARQEFIQMLAQGPTSSTLLFQIGLTYDREYRWADAAFYFRRAYVLDPSKGYWAYKCAHAYERQMEYATAAHWYLAAAKAQPTKYYYYYRLGTCLHKIDQSEAAYDALRLSLHGSKSVTERSRIESPIVERLAQIEEKAELSGVWSKDAMEVAISQSPKSAMTCLAIAEAAIDMRKNEVASSFARKSLLSAVNLPWADRGRAAEILASAGHLGDAVNALLDSRTVFMPDGVDQKKYLPSNWARKYRIYAEFLATRPVDSNIVLLESFHGAETSCNVLSLFQGMLDDERFAEAQFVWVINDRTKAHRSVLTSDRVFLIERESDDYLYFLATAKYLVNNVSFPPYFVRREGQRYLNTWHGTPMKTLGRSMRGSVLEFDNVERNFIQSTHLMVPNDLTRWALLHEYYLNDIYPGSLGAVGSPRLDQLINDAGNMREEIRHQLGISDEEKFVLVAPTWRGTASAPDSHEEALVAQLNALSSLEGTRVLLRAHHYSEAAVRAMNIPVEIVPPHINTYELLAAVDHLVSDYSSLVFDFLITEKPITLYIPDIVEYQDERGLYIHPSELPVGVAENLDRLVELVESPESVPASVQAEALQRFLPYEDGESTKRCIDWFLSEGQPQKAQNRRPTVLFHGGLLPNGIASSLLAVITKLVEQDVNVAVLVDSAAIRNDEERVALLKRFPENVRVIPRVGSTVMTPEEHYVRDQVEAGRSSPSDYMLDIYRNSWRRESRRILGDLSIDVAIEWDGYSSFWAGVMAHVGDDRTTRFIWQHNEMGEERSHKYPELENLFRMYPWFDEVVTVSEQLSNVNLSFFSGTDFLPQGEIRTVRNSLLFEEIASKALEYSPFEKSVASHNVVTIGRLSLEKNQRALIQAWKNVIGVFPDAVLHIIGSGPLEAQLLLEIEKLRLQSNVKLLGQLENPYPYVHGADLFVLPSLHEGQPVVLFEAMSLGTPIAASACPGNLEAMSLGYGEVLPTNWRELGTKIVSLLSAPEVAKGDFDAESFGRRAFSEFLVVTGLAT